MTDTFHQRTTTAVNIFHTSVTNVCVGGHCHGGLEMERWMPSITQKCGKATQHNTRHVADVGMVGLSMQYVTRSGQTQCRYLPTVLSAGCTPQEYYKELDMKSILPGRARSG